MIINTVSFLRIGLSVTGVILPNVTMIHDHFITRYFGLQSMKNFIKQAIF